MYSFVFILVGMYTNRRKGVAATEGHSGVQKPGPWVFAHLPLNQQKKAIALVTV